MNTLFTGRGLCLPFSAKTKASIACHAALLPALVHTGVDCGYAVAAHGSLRRDLDLIAVPFVDWAVPAEQLAGRLALACDGDLKGPTKHPHGRQLYQIHLGELTQGPYNSDPYIDLNVFSPWEKVQP